ncbi:MAG: type II secretion system major pseudopilin GspG [Anaeromyxobacter sp.]
MNQRKLRRASERGMTLIEIMVVMVILGLIAAAVAVNMVGAADKTRVDRAKQDVQSIANQGVEAFRAVRGRYPTREEGLKILIQEQFLKANNKDGNFKDPWDNEYLYEFPGTVHPDSYDVKSLGADGKAGGDGNNADIVNY